MMNKNLKSKKFYCSKPQVENYTNFSLCSKNKIINKLITSILCFAFLILPVEAMAVTQSELQRQKDYYAAQAEAARQQAAKKQQEAQAVQSQISSIDSEINQIQADIANTNQQISETTAKISELEANIQIKTEELIQEKEKMNKVVTSWYMEGKSGLFEAVMTSDSISEITTKQEYYDSIKQQISNQMERISKIQNDLKLEKDSQNIKKAELDNMKAQQVAYESSIQAKKSQKNQILSMTLAQKSRYLSDADKYEREVSRATEELRKLRAASARNNGETVVMSGSGGYSVNVNAYGLDPWGFVAFQCTSYAAWYWNAKLGKEWINTRPGSGSAWNWPALASDQGYSVSSTPRVGAIISWGRMNASPTYGHVAIVESVHGDGRIDISEYNWSVSEGFDKRFNVDPGYYGSYNYIY